MIEFRIGDRPVGPEHPPLVLAEVGINHEGELGKALQLVDAAAEAGAELVKFQCHITEKEMIPTDMTPGDISPERLWDIIKRCELTAEEEREVQEHCRRRGLIYMSTPFSREAADRLDSMGVPAFKIGSGECNNYPLVEHIARKGKPVILSTGMNNIASIRPAVDIFRRHGVPFALMHCTSLYPTPYEKLRLGALKDLARNFPDAVIGLSDHTLGIWTCLGGVALSACLLEKHFTISRAWPGPDTGMSIEPHELRDLVTGARAVWEARGGDKGILAEEQPVIDFAYASVVTIAPVRAGEAFTRENIWVKRPGTGPIPAARLEALFGTTARDDIPAGRPVRPEDVDGFAPGEPSAREG